MTPNDFRDYYKSLSNAELMDILDHRKDYQQTAIEVATEELESRQLSHEEIAKERLLIQTKELKKEEQRKKTDALKRKARNAGGSLFNSINPIRAEKPSIDRLIITISLLFLAGFLFRVVRDFAIIFATLQDFRDPDGTIVLYFLRLLLLPVAIVGFWRKRTFGWMLLAFYIIDSIVLAIWILFGIITWSSPIAVLNNILPQPSPVIYMFQIMFLAALFYLISNKNIRQIFGITKERLLATFSISVLVAIFLMVEF